jgi:hypothetical protein
MKTGDSVKMKYVIFAPKGLKTGGPEGMHQLAWALNKLGQEARLLAWPGTERNFAVNEYKNYEPKWCRVSEVNKKDIFIVSESIRLLPFWYLAFISRKRIYMWMHSVDFSLEKDLNQYERNNYPINSEWKPNAIRVSKFKFFLKRIGVLGIYHKVKHYTKLLKRSAFKWYVNIAPENYLFASYYSLHTVAKVKNSTSDLLLSGWVNGANQESIKDIEFCGCPKNHVAYNPAKSRELIKRIIEINELQSSEIHFMPIAGIKTDLEVYKLLSSCDLYLDLGFFPGLERTPREAIKMGCPVLLAKRGAARFYEDFPLSTTYLLDLSLLGPQQTYETTLKVLSLGKITNLNNQRTFQHFVFNEKATFLIEVERFILEMNKVNRRES